MRYTATTLKKIEDVFGELGYTIRYEKGSFQSGYCLVENKKIAVINKFLDTEARINALGDILSGLQIGEISLSPESSEMVARMMKHKAVTEDKSE